MGRILTAGQYCADFRAQDPVGSLVRGVVADLLDRHPGHECGVIEVAANSSGSYTIRSDGRTWDDDVAEADVPDEVVHMLLRASLDEESALVHIHAGAVVRDDRTAIIAGWPASGKSSAIASLVVAGFTYVTDERLTVAPDGRGVTGFPKPISLIEGSFESFAHLDPERTGIGASNGTTWQIPASSIGSVASQELRAPSVLVFIRFQSGVALRVGRVPSLQAAARLLGDSPDMIVRGHSGARSIVELTHSVPCVEVEYSDRNELIDAFDELLGDPPSPTPPSPTVMTGTANPGQQAPVSPNGLDTSQQYALAEGVTVWAADELALGYRHPPGDVIELDAANAAWLSLLSEANSLDEAIDELTMEMDLPAEQARALACQVVHGLWQAGVVAPVA